MSKWFLITRALAIPSVFLMLMYVKPGIAGFAAVLLGGSVVLVLNMTLYNVVTSSLMPKGCRGAGTALGYGLGVALFGGTASYLLVWLQSLNASWISRSTWPSCRRSASSSICSPGRRTASSSAGKNTFQKLEHR